MKAKKNSEQIKEAESSSRRVSDPRKKTFKSSAGGGNGDKGLEHKASLGLTHSTYNSRHKWDDIHVKSSKLDERSGDGRGRRGSSVHETTPKASA